MSTITFKCDLCAPGLITYEMLEALAGVINDGSLIVVPYGTTDVTLDSENIRGIILPATTLQVHLNTPNLELVVCYATNPPALELPGSNVTAYVLPTAISEYEQNTQWASCLGGIQSIISA